MKEQKQTKILVTVVVALVAILLVGRYAYDWLSGQAATNANTGVSTPSGTGTAANGDPAPEMLSDFDVAVYDIDGNALLLSEIADGRPLVVNFWATWCPYCVQELPDFQAIVADYGEQVAFSFIDVTDGERETVEIASSWLVDQGFDDLPAYFDTSSEASMRFGAWSLPTTVVFGADGVLEYTRVGQIDAALLRGALSTLV